MNDRSTSPRKAALHVSSETGRLERVVIGRADTFVQPEPINVTQRRFPPGHPDAPSREQLMTEFEQLVAALRDRNIEVLQPDPVDEAPDQLTPRDVGFVIDETFVVASMATPCRRHEWQGLTRLLDSLPAASVLRTPEDIVLEGGDVVYDRGTIYVGTGERSTPDAAAFLQHAFPDHAVVPIELKTEADGEDVLHLDCAFVPVGSEHALVYPKGMKRVPPEVQRYTWIEVPRAEQSRLGANVLSLSPDTVISRPTSSFVNGALRAIGIEVIELSFQETTKGGGSFRCASLPLVRR